MDEATAVETVRKELLEGERILNTEYWLELAAPHYRRCLETIASAPASRQQFVDLLISLFESKAISDEPVAFLMHTLQWAEILEWAKLCSDRAENETGARDWSLDAVIDVFDDPLKC